jgi:Secretion system C-terminal sorting domain
MAATPIDNGINVNLKVTTFNGAGYLNHTYNIVDSEIFLTVCYWFNNTLPIFQIENNFPIILPNNQQNYTINLTTFNSSSQTICDNFSTGPTSSITYLVNKQFDSANFKITPNPFSSTFEINSNQSISNYKVFDIVGKQIITANSKQALDSKTETLKSGVYLLELTFDNGKSDTLKLIKN